MKTKKNKKNYIWVVEIWFAKWFPTLGCRLNKTGGIEELQIWKRRNPGYKYKLKKYVAVD